MQLEHLNLIFRKAREDIEIKNQKLAQMEADYGDVVPRRDYERLKERAHVLEKDLEKVRKDQEALMKEHRLVRFNTQKSSFLQGQKS